MFYRHLIFFKIASPCIRTPLPLIDTRRNDVQNACYVFCKFSRLSKHWQLKLDFNQGNRKKIGRWQIGVVREALQRYVLLGTEFFFLFISQNSWNQLGIYFPHLKFFFIFKHVSASWAIRALQRLTVNWLPSGSSPPLLIPPAYSYPLAFCLSLITYWTYLVHRVNELKIPNKRWPSCWTRPTPRLYLWYAVMLITCVRI